METPSWVLVLPLGEVVLPFIQLFLSIYPTILSIESEVLELLDYKILINDFAAKKAKKLI